MSFQEVRSAKIDVHHHVYPQVMLQALDNAGGDPSGWYTPPWTEEANRAFSLDLGIKTTILSVTAPGPCIEKDPQKASQLARSCNEYCSSLKNRDPLTYGFFASLPSLFDTQACIAEIAYAFDVLHADGVTLFTRYGDSEGYLGHEAFTPIWAELSKRKAVAFIHPTHPVDTDLIHPSLPQPMFDYPHETGRTAMSLLVKNTLRAYPDCKIILSHAGGTLPYLIHRVATMLPLTSMSVGKSTEQLLEEAGWFYYDIALSSNPATLKALFEIAKPEKVLFGSDYPNAPTPGIQRFTHTLERCEVSGVDLGRVFRKNAEGLFPRLKDQGSAGCQWTDRMTQGAYASAVARI